MLILNKLKHWDYSLDKKKKPFWGGIGNLVRELLSQKTPISKKILTSFQFLEQYTVNMLWLSQLRMYIMFSKHWKGVCMHHSFSIAAHIAAVLLWANRRSLRNYSLSQPNEWSAAASDRCFESISETGSALIFNFFTRNKMDGIV